jgi:CBS domain-containing protein
MTNHDNSDKEQPLQRLPIRARRVLDGDGQQSVDSTVYCPRHEKSVAVAGCEGCNRFHALHFDAVTRASSVVCYSHAPESGRAPEASPRRVLDGPADPLAPLSAILTRDVLCVRPETSVEEIRALMLDRGISGLPVVDADGKPVGVVSRGDVLRADRDRGDAEELERVALRPEEREDLGVGPGFHAYEPSRLTAAEIMTPLVLALHENANVGQAAALMAFEGVHRLPVLSDDGDVVGIVSSLDVLRWFGQRSGYIIPPSATRRHG